MRRNARLTDNGSGKAGNAAGSARRKYLGRNARSSIENKVWLKEDESENVDIIDADALFAAMMAETEEERADRQVRSDALEAAKAEKEDADRQQQSRDIWWLFHHELTHRATKVSRAAQAQSEAIGEVSKA